MYFDNAATSWPKPMVVTESITNYLLNEGGNPSRTDNSEIDSIVYETRKLLAGLLNVNYPSQIIFTQNATEALNLALYGLLREGDHVITTVTEHNSIIRPLIDLKNRNLIEIDWVTCDSNGLINPSEISQKIKKNTKLIAVNHVSNVLGTIQPVEEIGEIAHKKNICFLLDASQSIGHIEIDNQKIKASLIAFPGHKGLYGPTGTGALYIDKSVELSPLKRGGTGILSELLDQPEGVPTKYESGTLNTLGIYGLNAALKYLNSKSIKVIQEQLNDMTKFLKKEIESLPNIVTYGKDTITGIISLNINGLHPGRVGYLLDNHYKIKVRTGLHCAPFIHKYIGTAPFGTIRISISIFTTKDEMNHLLNSLREIISNITKTKNLKIPNVDFSYK